MFHRRAARNSTTQPKAKTADGHLGSCWRDGRGWICSWDVGQQEEEENCRN